MPEMETYTHSLNEEIKSDEGILSSNLIMLRSRGENLKFITKLNLWGLKLRNISMVKSMPNLKVINMSGNCLNSLEPFTNCFNLCELYVRNNQIVNINEVAYLKYLSKFEKLWLTGNPCCQFFRINEKNDTIPCNSSVVYRYTVIRNLQFLIHLDQAAITSEERELSEKYGVLLTAPPPCPSLSSISTELSIGEQYPSETSENKLNDINNEGDNESNNTHSVVDITLSSDVEMKKSENGLSSLSNYTKQLSTNMLNINFLRESKSINENTVSINDSIHSQSSCNKKKCKNRLCLQDVTLKETNKIRQEYGLKPINKNKISSPAKRFQPVDQKNEKIVRNSIIRLLKTLNYDSLERIIQVAEKRLIRLSGSSIITVKHTEQNEHSEWTPNGTYDCSIYMNGGK